MRNVNSKGELDSAGMYESSKGPLFFQLKVHQRGKILKNLFAGTPELEPSNIILKIKSKVCIQIYKITENV